MCEARPQGSCYKSAPTAISSLVHRQQAKEFYCYFIAKLLLRSSQIRLTATKRCASPPKKYIKQPHLGGVKTIKTGLQA